MKFAYSHRMMSKETKCIGISHDSPEITAKENLRYDACITFSGNANPEGDVGIQTIAGGKYAVFLHKGQYESFGKTYGAIFSKWLPESNEELREAPCFELYLNRDPRRTKPENLRTEIYIPLK
jgi:AraC family transcriptional regulator